jgi:hypothetical protein
MMVVQVLAWSVAIAHIHGRNFFTSPSLNIHLMRATVVANVVCFIVAVIVDQGRIADVNSIVRGIRIVIIEVVAPKVNP